MHGIALKHKFAVLLGAIIVLCLGLNLAWQVQGGFRQTERELVQQARALSANMDAVWEFMVINQKLIDYDSAGNYEFKGLQCSIAGRSIGSLFSTKTEYVTHYVSETPRNHADTPDPFESGALAAFFEDSSLEEYYQVVQTENGQAFRYCAPMRMEKNCLECHGSPAGEIDVSGYPKEGLAEGDLYGALSLTIPMGAYEAASRENAVSNVVFSAMLLAASLVTVYIALTVLVTKPFGRVRAAMAAVGRGDLSVRLGQERSSAEARDMARGFDLMAEELAHMYDGLEEQVEERTKALAQANRALEEQQRDLEEMNRRLVDDNRFKGDFLAMMSHELRTPLAASMAFSGVLKERRPSQTEEEERLWREVETNNRRLLALINDVLEMARIDAGKERLHLGLVDVGDVVGLLQASVEPLAQQKGLRMEYAVDEGVPLFAADSEKLRRIVENLASNAVKFTPPGGSIEVAVRHDASRKRIVFEVSDTGVGIAEEDRERIFDRFTQVDGSTERLRGGSGLGLALVRELAEMHGGSVSVASSVGEGSTFSVEIPSDLELDL